HAGVEEGDREGAVADRALLPDKLVEPLPGDLAAAVGGVVDSRILTRRLSVERNLEAHRLAGRRTEHQVEVSCVEAEGDLAPGTQRSCTLPAIDPLALK